MSADPRGTTNSGEAPIWVADQWQHSNDHDEPTPLFLAARFSSCSCLPFAAKSFRGNPILGSNVLNRAGLHVTAYALPRQWPLSVGAGSSIC